MAVASAPALARPRENTEYAAIYGSVVWAGSSCSNLQADHLEAIQKLRDSGMKIEDFFSTEMQDLIVIAMLTLGKEPDRLKACELIIEQYGPRGRIMPGLVERSR